METDVSLAKAHLFFSLLPLGCFWLGTSTVLKSASRKNNFKVHLFVGESMQWIAEATMLQSRANILCL